MKERTVYMEGTKIITCLVSTDKPLHWRCAECAVHHERNVAEEQHRYICGANKQ